MFPQIVDIHEPLLHGVCHALIPAELNGIPDESVLSGLAELLYEADEALIARALFNLDTSTAASVPLYYALLPASSGSSSWLLARKVPPLRSRACHAIGVGVLVYQANPGTRPTTPDSLNTRSAFPVPVLLTVLLTTIGVSHWLLICRHILYASKRVMQKAL